MTAYNQTKGDHTDHNLVTRNEVEHYPEYNLSNQLLQHQLEMLQFLFYTEYDIIYETFELKHAAYL